MAINSQNLGWHQEFPSEPSGPQTVFVLDASAWSSGDTVNQFAAIGPLALTATAAVELMTPDSESEFLRRQIRARHALEVATIFLPNASRYKRFLCGTETLDGLREDSARFLQIFNLFCRLPNFQEWGRGFQALATERNEGYEAWAREVEVAAVNVRDAVVELARENGMELDLTERAERQMILRALGRTLPNNALDRYLLPDLLPERADAAFYYLRLYRQYILENLPNRAASAGIAPNDFGDSDLALFVGPYMEMLRGRIGVGIIAETKWNDLARNIDEWFPLGSPEWASGHLGARFLGAPEDR